MNWLQLSAKEWRRRPLRISVTAAGVAIATAALFSLLAFQRGYREGVRNELDRLGAHILVVPKGCPYDAASIALHGANWPCYLRSRYLEEVRSVNGIAAAAPAFMAAVYDAAGLQTVYVGVETNFLALKNAWRIDGKFPERDGDLLLGAEVSRRKGWRIGEEVQLPEQQQNGTVTGILRPTNGADDTFIYLSLGDAQRRFHHADELTHILVRLADPNQLDEVVTKLRGCDAGLSMNIVPLTHLFRSVQSLVNSTRLLLGCIAAVALLAAGTGVSNTILMAVSERAREIGVMRAVGASRADIFRLVWLETLQVCVAGAVFGVTSAFLASRLVEQWVRARLPFAPTDALVRWEWWIAAACLGCAVVLGTMAGFFPAWRAASVPPMRAISAFGSTV